MSINAMTDMGDISYSKECKRLLDLYDEIGTNSDKKHVKRKAKSFLKHK